MVGYPVTFHACKIDPPVPGISRYIQYWATQVGWADMKLASPDIT